LRLRDEAGDSVPPRALFGVWRAEPSIMAKTGDRLDPYRVDDQLSFVMADWSVQEGHFGGRAVHPHIADFMISLKSITICPLLQDLMAMA